MFKFCVSAVCLVFFTFSLLCHSQDVVANPEIIGAPKCKACHMARTGDQWKIWTESSHARAFETLASEEAGKIATAKGIGNPQQEDACLKCHATRASLGTGVVVSEKGGYTDSEGVGCESCHGPGSEYKPKKVMVDPEAARAAGLVMNNTADACSRCHNEESPTFKGFDFEARWAEIAHPVPSDEDVSSEPLATSAGMPNVVTFKSSVGEVHFPHKMHVEDLDVECTECHHQIHAKELETPHPDYLTSSWISCQSCHNTNSADSKKYYKCSDCHHLNPSNVADETLSSKVVVHKSCWKCHASGTGVQASESCGDCHVKAEK
jgi:hypothetical protein